MLRLKPSAEERLVHQAGVAATLWLFTQIRWEARDGPIERMISPELHPDKKCCIPVALLPNFHFDCAL